MTIDEINKNLLKSADRLCKKLGYKTLDEIIVETEERIREENEKMSVWERVARFCQEVYGSYIDWEERFYLCGECGEPVYECDYNEHGDYYSEDGEGPICPVCEYNYGQDE